MSSSDMALPEIVIPDIKELGPRPLNNEASMERVGIRNADLAELGINRDEFNWCVSTAWNLFNTLGRLCTPDEALESNAPGLLFFSRETKPDEVAIRAVWNDRRFHSVCYYRGIRGPAGGLDEKMMLALQELSSTTSRAGIDTRLRRAGVTPAEFETWLNYYPFKKRYLELSEKALKNAEASVNMALTSGAVAGKLDFIKYFDERTGKFDPNKKQMLDVQNVLQGIVSILQKHITDPELLRAIGGDLAVLAAGAGIDPT